MQDNISLRVRHSQNQFELNDLSSTTLVSDLIAKIAQQLKCKPEQVSIKYGFPPKVLNASEDASLDSVGITYGDSLIVETKTNDFPKKVPDTKEDV